MAKGTEFKKDFGNQSTRGYSKEYMKVYCSWLRSLSKKDKEKMSSYNDRSKTKKQLKQERIQKKKEKMERQLTYSKKHSMMAISKATNT